MFQSHRTRFIPSVESLENRNCPAALMAVTPAQLAALHDAAGFDLVADIGQPVSLPVPDAVLVMPLPTALHWFIEGYNQVAVTVRAGILEDAWFGVDEALAQNLADSLNVPLLSPVPTLSSPGKLPATPELLDLLTVSELGQPMQHEWLAAQLGADPKSLAAPDGTLKLAVASPEGYLAHSLTSADGRIWTLTGIEQTASLTPTLGLWELTVG